jgi:histidyl-tRNA synthetase
MRLRNWIADAWRRVALRNGFEEYDAPIFEHLDLFTIKSGEEIAEQLFRFTDRGGRHLAIRPEITPSLARMVNAKIRSLPLPIKWFAVPRLCRAENPQRGRLREFLQWNVDVIGSDDVLADAECIFVAVDLLRELGLGPDDVQVRIGHRGVAAAALAAAGIAPDDHERALAVLDKRPRVSDEQFAKLAGGLGLTAEQTRAVCRVQDCDDLDEAGRLLAAAGGAEQPLRQLRQLLEHLEWMQVRPYCRLDLRVVRGLAYYTGVVYEVFDAAQSLRAVAGGGRYDNLLEVLGGPRMGATGFGMGDVVLGLLLEQAGRVPAAVRARAVDYFVIDAEADVMPAVVDLVARLRRTGWSAEFSYKRQGIAKQLKEANRRGARTALIVEPGAEALSVKDLAAGRQTQTTRAAFLDGLRPPGGRAGEPPPGP